MDTRLEPLEKPAFPMTLAYLFSKFKFGKVLSPLKVVYARLPLAFALFTNSIGALEKKMVLKKELVYLIRHYVAQINVCSFCTDIGVSIAIQDKMNAAKFHEVGEYKLSTLFNEKEKCALQFAEELTIRKLVSDETFAKAAQLFTGRELSEIAWTVATEHYYNLINIAFDIQSDQLCAIKGT